MSSFTKYQQTIAPLRKLDIQQSRKIQSLNIKSVFQFSFNSHTVQEAVHFNFLAGVSLRLLKGCNKKIYVDFYARFWPYCTKYA